ncbi:MAG: prepilin-type N-terminal cleavage/methylation domain-containing protein [bacterium]
MKRAPRRKRGSWKTGGFTLIELMIVIAIIGILFSILIPSFINAMDRTRYRACLSALSSIKTGLEILRPETDFKTNPVCIGGTNTIENCLAEEIIGKIGAAWATPVDLDTRIGRTCEMFGGGLGWTMAGQVTVVGDTEYDIKGHSSRGFNECDICVTESDYAPADAQTCLSGIATACP